MARKPNTPETTPVVALNHAAIAQAGAAATQLAELTAGYSADRDLVNQLLGQAQMADAFGKFSQTVWSSKLAFVKENKLYQQLAGRKMPNGLELSGTWAEFCSLLGVSDEKANTDIANLKAFGAEALDAMSQMGIGYRELRQFRRLPDDGKTALIEAARSGDKDALLEVAETLLERQMREKAVLEAELQEAEESLAAKDKVIEKQSEKLDAHAERLARPFKPKKGSPALTQADADALQELTEATTACEVEFARLTTVVGELAQHDSAAMRERALQSARYMVAWVRQMVTDNALDVLVDDETLAGRPSWLPSVDGSDKG